MFRLDAAWVSGLAVAVAMLAFPGTTQAQTGLTVQLPTRSVFSVRTVVSVPDGGRMHLGGVSRAAYGANSRGVPGLSNVPFVNRPFRNRGIGSSASAGGASVKVQIISLDEMEAELLGSTRPNFAIDRNSSDPNGTVEVQKKAELLSRHIGRKRR